MRSKLGHSKKWLYQVISLLSFNGGLVNAITFACFFHNPVGYVTGNITLVAFFMINLEWPLVISIIIAIIFFLLGSILSGLTTSQIENNNNTNHLKYSQKYRWIFILEICLILLGFLGLLSRIGFSKYLLAMAMGVQNGLTTSYGTSIIRTTHMTGTLTDLGILIARKLTGQSIQIWRLNIHLILIFGFFFGALVGIFLFKNFQYYSLIPSILIYLFMLN